MRPFVSPLLAFRPPALLSIVSVAICLSACGDDVAPKPGQALMDDVGGVNGADAGSDAAPSSEADSGDGEDTGEQVQGGDVGSVPDSGGESVPDSGGEEDAGTPVDCVDGDGACGAGCYVIDDDDCPLDCRDPSTWPPSWVAFEDEVLVLTNQMRASDQSCGGVPYPSVPPLASDPQLREAARCHSLDMAERDYFSHISPEGESPIDRITAAGYHWSDLKENVAGGPPTPAVVVPGWMNSPHHCTGIMSADMTEIGVGYAFDIFADPDPVNDWKHYWTQAFGHPR